MGDETTQIEDPTEDDEEIEDEKPAVIDPAALVAQIVEQVGEQTGKEIDRRINALVKTLGTDYGLKKAEPAKEQLKNQADDRVLLRLRKGAVAEAVSLAKFPDEETRTAARARALRLADMLPLDEDEDDYSFAERIVSEVTDELTSLRTLYEEQTRADLKRRGLLSDEAEEEEGGQPPKKPGKSGPDPEKEFKAGVDRAKAMFPPADKE